MLNRTERHTSALTAALKYFLFKMSTNAVRKRYLQVSERSSLTPNMLQSVIAKFHYTGPNGPDPTRPDRTRPDKVRALYRRQAKFHCTGPTGPARTRADFFAARISEKLRWVRAGLRQSPSGSARVRSGPVGPV